MAPTNIINRSMTANEWLMLLLLSVLWGGSFFFVAILIKSLPPFTIVFLRVGIARGDAACSWCRERSARPCPPRLARGARSSQWGCSTTQSRSA